KTKEQLKTDKLVKRATRLLMQQKNINERDAYNRLQELAADNNKTISVIAQNIIEVCQLLSPTRR
ncbi:MAG: ANTAR domain-containing protein, partial [Psychromonas sp.]